MKYSLGQGRVEKDTGKALKVWLEEWGDSVWIPYSCIHDDSEVFDDEDNSRGEVIVKQWWAESKGFYR